MENFSLINFIDEAAPLTKYLGGLFIILLFIFVSNYIAKLLQWGTEKLLQKHKILSKGWLDLFVKNKVFTRFFFTFAIVLIISSANVLLQGPYQNLTAIVVRMLNVLFIIMFTVSLGALVSVLSDKYTKRFALPVKGIAQAVKVIIWVLAMILIVATLINKHPVYLLGGLTALSAIILLIFKDSILGLTSGFQLLLNDLVRVGDWIEIPSQRADGEVIDILLTTVRVRNWDNTIVNIPAYDLVSASFTNWRGMSESGGRRIKRSLKIDLRTVKFLTKEEVKKLSEIKLIREYLQNKEHEIEQVNKDRHNENDPYNARRLTNLGTFRAYCLAYLKQNPHIHKTFTCMVRQLEPTAEGLPLEVYAFTNDTNWTVYEGIQSDIFDHLIAIMPLFGLKIFQNMIAITDRN